MLAPVVDPQLAPLSKFGLETPPPGGERLSCVATCGPKMT